MAKKNLCDGNLYLNVGSRNIHVMSAGTFIDESFVKKHAATNSKFHLEQQVDHEIKAEFKRLFRELKYTQFEKDLRLKCLEIMDCFNTVYTKKNHFISFALAAYEEFCAIPREDQARLHEADVNLFRKALYSSAFSVIISIASDFYNYLVLKDLYNVTFSIDIGLAGDNYTYYISEACNIENQNPGSGKLFLEEKNVSQAETDLFLNHPNTGHDFLNKLGILAFPKLSQIILLHHELSSGGGFPRAIKRSHMSIWDSIVILSDSLVEISSEHGFEIDTIKFLNTFKTEKIQDVPVSKVYRNLITVLSHLGYREAG